MVNGEGSCAAPDIECREGENAAAFYVEKGALFSVVCAAIETLLLTSNSPLKISGPRC
jgi:hypothetical protein